MLGKALYFPTIDIDDPTWLRSAILFWNKIQTIVPDAVVNPYQNDDSRACFEEGYLSPLLCAPNQQIIDQLGDRLAETNKFDIYTKEKNAIFPRISETHLHEKLQSVSNRIHIDKMSTSSIRAILSVNIENVDERKFRDVDDYMLDRPFMDKEAYYNIDKKYTESIADCLRRSYKDGTAYDDENGTWLLLRGTFANNYMTALASELSREHDLSPLTSSERYHGEFCIYRYNKSTDSFSQNAARGALIAVAIRALKVDSSVPISKLVKFRERRKDQYDELTREMEILTSELAGKAGKRRHDGAEWLHVEAAKIYNERVKPKLLSLQQELKLHGVQSVWDGAVRALTITVPSTSATAYFSGLSGLALLGAGAALAITDIGVKANIAKRRVKLAHPFTYLHEAQDKFGLPSLGDSD